jgi:hypothetical protein
MHAPIRAVALALLTAVAAPARAADPLIGMAQVTRSDGVKIFVLTGTYRDDAKCRKLLPELVNKAILDAPPAGLSAKMAFVVCDSKAPAGSEFAMLRGEAKPNRIIFFTENFRALAVPATGGRAAERKVCDYLKQRVLQRFGVSGECIEP